MHVLVIKVWTRWNILLEIHRLVITNKFTSLGIQIRGGPFGRTGIQVHSMFGNAMIVVVAESVLGQIRRESIRI